MDLGAAHPVHLEVEDEHGLVLGARFEGHHQPGGTDDGSGEDREVAEGRAHVDEGLPLAEVPADHRRHRRLVLAGLAQGGPDRAVVVAHVIGDVADLDRLWRPFAPAERGHEAVAELGRRDEVPDELLAGDPRAGDQGLEALPAVLVGLAVEE